MKRRLTIIAMPSLALACLLMLAGPAHAQRNTNDGYAGSVIFPLSRSYGRGYRNIDSYQTFYPAGNPVADSGDMTRAYMSVHVPANAQVFFDDTPTVQTGADRVFVSPPLKASANYAYTITAKWTENGKNRQETRTIPLSRGQTVDVDFTMHQPQTTQPANLGAGAANNHKQ